MTVRQPRYSKEEFARRGNEIYESQVRPQFEEGNYGKIVARSGRLCLIDIETWAFEMADTPIEALEKPNVSVQKLKLVLSKIAKINWICSKSYQI
jgi:hypothetical protein